jgi:hypothetical protein
MTDWKAVLLKLRRHYKPLSKVAAEVGMSEDRLRKIAANGTKTMLYENGKKIMDLHDQYVPKTT